MTALLACDEPAPVLIERLAAEGEATRADLFMAVDAGNLWQAAERLAGRPLDPLDPALVRALHGDG